jgi:hypothetical protein
MSSPSAALLDVPIGRATTTANLPIIFHCWGSVDSVCIRVTASGVTIRGITFAACDSTGFDCAATIVSASGLQAPPLSIANCTFSGLTSNPTTVGTDGFLPALLQVSNMGTVVYKTNSTSTSTSTPSTATRSISESDNTTTATTGSSNSTTTTSTAGNSNSTAGNSTSTAGNSTTTTNSTTVSPPAPAPTPAMSVVNTTTVYPSAPGVPDRTVAGLNLTDIRFIDCHRQSFLKALATNVDMARIYVYHAGFGWAYPSSLFQIENDYNSSIYASTKGIPPICVVYTLMHDHQETTYLTNSLTLRACG